MGSNDKRTQRTKLEMLSHSDLGERARRIKIYTKRCYKVIIYLFKFLNKEFINQRHLGKVEKGPRDHFNTSCNKSDGFRCFPTLVETRFVNPPNDACSGHTGMVGP